MPAKAPKKKEVSGAGYPLSFSSSLPPNAQIVPRSLAPQALSFVARRDSLDWKDISADEIYNRVTTKVQPGSIILFHNAGLNTPEALPGILEYLIGEGYEIVPISEILLDGEYTIDHEGRQWAADENAKT